ncbi:hypothetical protein [Bacillus dakarensis]|uniref:hypothetical protein n=1 Tax=Robertmurraya dakarensis TaxID=1926278 RepID=UPI000981E629|nr:hypothetical protein [Bacillus dakarensis]
MKRKKRNIFPFVILTVTHLFLLLYTLIKNKNKRTLISLLFSNIGLAYVFEYIILNLLQAYRYKIKVFNEPYFNNIFGAILSQAIFIPFTAVFISAFRLKWRGKAAFIFYFHIIEQLFVKIKVYRTNWWSPFLTSSLLPIYFYISDKWYELLKEGSSLIKMMSHWLANLVIVTNLLFVLVLTRQLRFGRGRYHSLKEHFKIAPLYAIGHSAISTWCVWRKGYFGLMLSILVAAGMDWVLYKKRVVKHSFIIPGLNLYLHAFLSFGTAWFKKMLNRVGKNEGRA